MTLSEIKNELEKIYKVRNSWDGAKGPFTEPAIRQRELILIKQKILYRIEDAKLLKDRNEESLNTAIYRIINDCLNKI